MSSVSLQPAATLEQRCNALKLEVKNLQNAFADENGRKMGRDDIKADASFLAKWQEYENLSAIVKGKRVPHPDLESTQAIMKKLETASEETRRAKEEARARKKKRKSDEMDAPEQEDAHLQQTPSKRKREPMGPPTMLAMTPQKARQSPEALEDSPVAAKPAVLGPTPQKAGMIMGLFDGIPEASTPSKAQLVPGTPTSKRVPLQQVTGNTTVKVSAFKIPNTPSRSRPTTSSQTVAVEAATPERSRARDFDSDARQMLKTPMSSGRKFMLAQFLTPTKDRASTQSLSEAFSVREISAGNDRVSEQAKTPSSTAKKYATPACLKQYMDPQPHIESVAQSTEEDLFVQKAKRPTILRRTRSKPFGGYRALLKERDEIIAEQRRIDEEMRLEENEEEILREMEMEEQDFGPVSSVAGVSAVVHAVPETQYEDLMAFAAELDGDGFFADDVGAEIKAADEVDRRKREEAGMAPQRVYKKKGLKRQTKRVIMRPTRSKPASKPATRPNTKAPAEPKLDSDASEASNSDDGHDPLATEDQQEPTSPSKTKKKSASKKPAKADAQKAAPAKKKGVPAASDHANYRKLKIKNQNTKANRGRGRFGGRR